MGLPGGAEGEAGGSLISCTFTALSGRDSTRGRIRVETLVQVRGVPKFTLGRGAKVLGRRGEALERGEAEASCWDWAFLRSAHMLDSR